ncbi:MAG: type II secretion system protein [Planctomycetota bacterium]|jgi:prepilin-type N-terminal cleavage/methylation domain-containing protein
MARRKAFTLIELLVVIAIIALLMSILMPALSRAKQQTKAVICQSNLHEWGLAFKMFTDENNGYFIKSYFWVQYMQPYCKSGEIRSDFLLCAPGDPEEQPAKTKKLFFCPTSTKTWAQGGRHPFVAWETDDIDGGLIRGSYGLNQWVTLNTGGGRSFELLWKTPNTKGAMYVPMLLDCTMFYNVCPYHKDEPPAYDGDPSSGNDNEIRRVCINRHQRAINIVLLDFSVRKTGLKDLWDLHWHRNWNPNNDPPPKWPSWLEGAGAQ